MRYFIMLVISVVCVAFSDVLSATDGIPRGDISFTAFALLFLLFFSTTLLTIVYVRIQATRNIRESEQHYKEIFDNINDAILIFDLPPYRVLRANCRAEELFGLKQEEFRTDIEILRKTSVEEGEYTAEHAMEIVQSTTEDNPRDFVWQAKHVSGRRFWLEGRSQVVRIGENKRLVLVGRDITQRKCAEESVRESEQHLRSILQALDEAVIATDTAGNIIRMNQAAEELTGWKPDDAAGMPVFAVCRFEDETGVSVNDPIETVIQTGEPVQSNNHSRLLRNTRDETVRISFAAAPVCSGGGKNIGTVLVLRDITREKELEEKLRHSEKMDSIGQLAGGLAHDFNNMLGGILSASEILYSCCEHDERGRRIARNITNTVERASNLTEKLLLFSRKGQPVFQTVDMHDIITDASDIFTESFPPDITITRRLRARHHHVNGDPTQLQNIILNLGVNARDAMDEQGDLDIETTDETLNADFCEESVWNLRPGSYIRLTIRDTGTGIPADIADRVFEPFFTTKETGKGTGMGLSAVYGAVQEHHGVVTFHSDEGAGTVFTVLLPAVAAPADGDDSVSRETDTPNDSTLTVLVVEDESMVRELLRTQLEEVGHTVLEAENGRIGVEVFSEHRDAVNLVILDMIMPEMNGETCFEHLQEIRPDIPVIISSGYLRDARISELERRGAAGFLKKPYSFARLQELLSSVIPKNRRLI